MHFLKRSGKYILMYIAVMAISGFGQNTITFNVDGATTIVNKEIFGLLMERLGRQWDGSGSINVGMNSSVPNTNGMRKDVIDGFVECGIGAIEWPGGCAGNNYDWGSNKTSTTQIGADRFIQFCKLTGAEAVVAGKPSGNDASSNLAFAKYIINDLKYPLKWFKIGNEIWGGCGTNYTNGYTSGYSTNYDKLKDLRSTENGKDLKIIAAASSMEGNYSWIPTYYSSIGSKMDGIEFHDYVYRRDFSSTNPTTANYWQVMNDVYSGDFHSHLNTILSTMNSSDPSKRVKVVMDEWGDWLKSLSDGWSQQITVMDAVSAGGHLNQFIANADRVGVCCLAQGVNCIHSVININTSGVMVKTPTFYVFKMLKPHHTNNAKFAPITASKFENANGSTPSGNASASVDASGYVNVSITNTDLSATRQVVVTLTSSHEYKVVSAEVVTGANINSTNDFGKAEEVNIKTLDASSYSISEKKLTVTMPTKSVVMIRLLPTNVAVKPGSMQCGHADVFSIRAGSGGTVFLTSPAGWTKPVAISLHRVDGRTLADGISKTLQAGKSALILGRNIGKGVYIVKIAGEDSNLSKRIVIAR